MSVGNVDRSAFDEHERAIFEHAFHGYRDDVLGPFALEDRMTSICGLSFLAGAASAIGRLYQTALDGSAADVRAEAQRLAAEILTLNDRLGEDAHARAAQ